MILYIKNSKGSFRNLLELISEFSKVAEKSLAVLYTNNENMEFSLTMRNNRNIDQ